METKPRKESLLQGVPLFHEESHKLKIYCSPLLVLYLNTAKKFRGQKPIFYLS